MKNRKYNGECCMCGDEGLSHELFRCHVCHFRSQHRYCSNLYPKVDSYRVCNWCLVQKDDNLTTTNTTVIHLSKPKGLKPISPIKKPSIRTPEAQSLSRREQISALHSHVKDDQAKKINSSQEMSKNYFSSTRRSNGDDNENGPIIIKHRFRTKVRRYKFLNEVSCWHIINIG